MKKNNVTIYKKSIRIVSVVLSDDTEIKIWETKDGDSRVLITKGGAVTQIDYPGCHYLNINDADIKGATVCLSSGEKDWTEFKYVTDDNPLE